MRKVEREKKEEKEWEKRKGRKQCGKFSREKI
jgi:hypothetical protein